MVRPVLTTSAVDTPAYKCVAGVVRLCPGHRATPVPDSGQTTDSPARNNGAKQHIARGYACGL